MRVTNFFFVTIQLVGHRQKLNKLLTSRASEARFSGYKLSLKGLVFILLCFLTWPIVHVEIESYRLDFQRRLSDAQYLCYNMPRRCHIEIEFQRLGLLKVKPSLRNSIFKLWLRTTPLVNHVQVPISNLIFCLCLMSLILRNTQTNNIQSSSPLSLLFHLFHSSFTHTISTHLHIQNVR